MTDQIVCITCGNRATPMAGGWRFKEWFCPHCKSKLMV